MRDRFFKGYCKAGSFTSKSFIIDAVLGKSCRIFVSRNLGRKIRGFIPYSVLYIKFRV